MTERKCVVFDAAVWIKMGRSLPAAARAETRALGLQRRIERGRLERPSRSRSSFGYVGAYSLW